jgi:hypothetical protein
LEEAEKIIISLEEEVNDFKDMTVFLETVKNDEEAIKIRKRIQVILENLKKKGKFYTKKNIALHRTEEFASLVKIGKGDIPM